MGFMEGQRVMEVKKRQNIKSTQKNIATDTSAAATVYNDEVHFLKGVTR